VTPSSTTAVRAAWTSPSRAGTVPEPEALDRSLVVHRAAVAHT
jgi:hypothetical protein